MEWIIRYVISTLINTFVIITIVDMVLMGIPMPTFSRKNSISRFMVLKENRIDLQKGNSCS